MTMLALQVLVVTTLQATPTEVGIIRAVQFLPYLLLGFVIGALVDGWRRRPVLVWTGFGIAAALLCVPVLWVSGALTLWTLGAVVAVLGILSVLHSAAHQSFLPRLVPRARLLPANARLDQSATVAETTGPALAGGLVALLGAPMVMLVDALAHLVAAVLLWRIRVDEPRPARVRRHLGREILQGLRWMYRHPTLAHLAWSTHVWFVGNSILLTVFAPFALRPLGLDPFGYGVVLAAAGVGGLAGALLATRLGRRLGAGWTVVLGRALVPLAWAIIALAPTAASSGVVITIAVVALAQALYGFGMGIENANEMGYWQAQTPDELQGRTNASRRSVNRTALVVGALVGGMLADALGYRPALWIGVAIFVVAAVILAVSPFRRERHAADDEGDVG